MWSAAWTETSLRAIGVLTAILLALYLLRVAFRFLSNYLAHKAAWYLVGDLRTKIYDKTTHWTWASSTIPSRPAT